MKAFVDGLKDSRKIIDVQDRVAKIMRSGVYSEGEMTAEFEIAISERYNGRPVVAFNSCGSALYTVFRWLVSKSHSKIVVQNNTFYATYAMAAEAGLTPVLCDSSPEDPSMGFDSMVAAVELSGAKAVCLTHVGGWIAADYEKIAEWCTDHHIYLVEDAAHAFGTVNAKNYSAGDLGDATCFSFYPTKAVPGGEGGALLVADYRTTLLNFSLEFRSYGKFKGSKGVIHYSKGFNLRMSEFDAAVLCVQMDYIDETMANRLSTAKQLEDAGFHCLMGKVDIHSNYYKYPIVKSEGLRTTGKIYSLTDQIAGANVNAKYDVEYPVPLHNSRVWAEGHICLPIGEHLYSGLTGEEIRKMLTIEETVS